MRQTLKPSTTLKLGGCKKMQQTENTFHKIQFIKDPIYKTIRCDIEGICKAFEFFKLFFLTLISPDAYKAEELFTSWTCYPLGKVHDDKLIKEISVEEIYRPVFFL